VHGITALEGIINSGFKLLYFTDATAHVTRKECCRNSTTNSTDAWIDRVLGNSLDNKYFFAFSALGFLTTANWTRYKMHVLSAGSVRKGLEAYITGNPQLLNKYKKRGAGTTSNRPLLDLMRIVLPPPCDNDVPEHIVTFRELMSCRKIALLTEEGGDRFVFMESLYQHPHERIYKLPDNEVNALFPASLKVFHVGGSVFLFKNNFLPRARAFIESGTAHYFLRNETLLTFLSELNLARKKGTFGKYSGDAPPKLSLASRLSVIFLVFMCGNLISSVSFFTEILPLLKASVSRVKFRVGNLCRKKWPQIW